MGFLQKLDFLINQKGINKNILSKESGIPYTTIDGFYKKGYENAKLSTIKKLASYFNVSLDYLMGDTTNKILKFDYETNKFINFNEKDFDILEKYYILDEHGKKLVNLILNCEYERCNSVKVEKLIARGHESDKPIEVEIKSNIKPKPTDEEF